ncbi:MAG: hypothetical protein B7733_19935 [Myxococcales bacterium FL481]|nr:MAG: hypothetical protein B7733_19935 [Myxococcales bacterium FL481]
MSQSSAAETFIAADTVVEGKVVARSTTIRIHGHVSRGIATGGVVVVDAPGRVAHGITAARLELSGRVAGPVSVRGELRVRDAGECRGAVVCTRLDADATARVLGQVQCRGGVVPPVTVAAPAQAHGVDAAATASPKSIDRPESSSDRPESSSVAAAQRERQGEPGLNRPPQGRRSIPNSRSTPDAGAARSPVWGWRRVGWVGFPAALVVGIAFERPRPVEPAESLEVAEQPPFVATGYVLIPDEPRFEHGRVPPLNEIYWHAASSSSLRTHAARWGLPGSELRALNPQLDLSSPVAEGTALRVYSAPLDQTALSVGAPNRGELVDGVPMPEGEHWELRSHRRRVYGTTSTIRALVSVLGEYGRRFPDAPRVRVGDLSARRGRFAPPHRSHQSGRDVDLYYIRTDGHRYGMLTRERFDAQKNWFLIRRLIDTGEVQAIFVAHPMREWIVQQASQDLPRPQLRAYLSVVKGDDHHDRHMHIRFRCTPGNRRCYHHSVISRPLRPEVVLANGPTDGAQARPPGEDDSNAAPDQDHDDRSRP